MSRHSRFSFSTVTPASPAPPPESQAVRNSHDGMVARLRVMLSVLSGMKLFFPCTIANLPDNPNPIKPPGTWKTPPIQNEPIPLKALPLAHRHDEDAGRRVTVDVFFVYPFGIMVERTVKAQETVHRGGRYSYRTVESKKGRPSLWKSLHSSQVVFYASTFFSLSTQNSELRTFFPPCRLPIANWLRSALLRLLLKKQNKSSKIIL